MCCRISARFVSDITSPFQPMNDSIKYPCYVPAEKKVCFVTTLLLYSLSSKEEIMDDVQDKILFLKILLTKSPSAASEAMPSA
jgi:hypothetical protein